MNVICSKVSALPCEQEVIAVYSNSTKVAVQLSNGSILEYSAGMLLWQWGVMERITSFFMFCRRRLDAMDAKGW